MMVILITGASGGIGFELLKKCAVNEGHTVIAVSRHTKNIQAWIIRENRYNVLVIKADIGRESQIVKIAATLKKLELYPDIVVNNAAHFLKKDFAEISLKELEEVYRVNVFSVFRLTQVMVPLMSRKSKTHIVNIGSMGGVQGSSKFAGLSAYSSSKAALAGLSECLAEELKSHAIAVNCLALGSVQTDMLKKAFPGYKAPLSAAQMADFIYDFMRQGQNYFNGKVLPVSSATP
ncbi:MAG TPA: SDR family oxidoreductase [Bacteroidia bacterium]|nr:SDR family oxidoreductase [Bacteroidia bacterium]